MPVDLPKVALFALSGVAFVTCGIGIGIQRGSNPVLLLVTIFFGVVALYFMAVLALARRWALELNEDGFRDRARFRPAASVAWADVESVVARPLALGNQQVVVSLRRSSDRSVIASRLYINSGLLQGGPERVLKAMKQHLRDADGPVS